MGINYDFETYNKKIIKDFKPYPLLNKAGSKTERFEEVFKALYDKKMIEKEIIDMHVIIRQQFPLSMHDGGTVKRVIQFVLRSSIKDNIDIKGIQRVFKFLQFSNNNVAFFQIGPRLYDILPHFQS